VPDEEVSSDEDDDDDQDRFTFPKDAKSAILMTRQVFQPAGYYWTASQLWMYSVMESY
jgi:hypothetical protein